MFLKVRLAEEPGRHDHPQPLPIAALAGAVGWTDDGEVRRSVARMLAALPPGGRVAHVGALPGRAPRAVRLVVQGIGHDEIAGVLERLGWRGSICAVTEILTDLGEVLPRFRLAVDVAAARGCCPGSAWIGLELYHAGEWGNEPDSWLVTRDGATGARSWSGWRTVAGAWRRRRRG